MNDDLKETATDLLHVLWRGVPSDYKRRYRTNIWQQFENQVRSAAYTANLARFVNSLCVKLQVQPRKAEERERLEAILSSGEDRPLLKLLRDETTLLILKVRLRQEKAREEFTDEDTEEEKLKEAWKEAEDDGQLSL